MKNPASLVCGGDKASGGSLTKHFESTKNTSAANTKITFSKCISIYNPASSTIHFWSLRHFALEKNEKNAVFNTLYFFET